MATRPELSITQNRHGDHKLDVDAILNRAAIALARSQKLVDSWLPPSHRERNAQVAQNTDDGPGSRSTNDTEELVGRPERLGLGAVMPVAVLGDLSGRTGTVGSEIEKLRKQMLGNRAGKENASRVRGGTLDGYPGASSRARAATVQKRPVSDGEDEEEGGGRATLLRSNRGKNMASKEQVENDADEPITLPNLKTATNHMGLGSFEVSAVTSSNGQNHRLHEETSADISSALKSKGATATHIKRPATYLDEVLAERSKKKKKKRRKNLDEDGT